MSHVHFHYIKTTPSIPKPWHGAVEEEMQLYKMAKVIPLDSDPLKWCKENEHLYPHLSKLSKCYLAVQATSVASERVLSTAGAHCDSSKSSPVVVCSVDPNADTD